MTPDEAMTFATNETARLITNAGAVGKLLIEAYQRIADLENQPTIREMEARIADLEHALATRERAIENMRGDQRFG